MSVELLCSADDDDVSAAPDLSAILKTEVRTSDLVLPFHLKKDIFFLEAGTEKLMANNTKLITTLLALANRIFKGNELPYRVKLSKRGTYTVDALRMASIIKMLPVLTRVKDSDEVFAHDLELLLNEYRIHPISEYRWIGGGDGTLEFALLANEFVLHLRLRAKETKLTYRMSQWMRNVDKRAKKLRIYFEWLVRKAARLVFIRLDLHLRKGDPLDMEALDELERQLQGRREREHLAFMLGLDPGEIEFGVERVSFFEITTARDQFLDAVRHDKELKKGLIGFVWCIELSVEGYHIHIAWIYDGSIQLGYDHAALADKLGAKWIKQTEGRGYFFNCNRKKYDQPACGIVEYSDSAKLSNVWRALLYLVKKSQLVRAKSSGKAKTFGTGQMTPVRKGRPRSKADGLEQVDLDTS